MQAMMRMYEFVEIEGLLMLDLFGDSADASKNDESVAS
jgi:hypothetical protein